MKSRATLWAAAGAMALAGCAAASGDSELALESAEARESYSLGHVIGSQMRENVGGVDEEAFLEGLGDAFGDTSRLSSEEIAMSLASLERKKTEADEAERAAAAEKNRADGDAFRASFAEQPEVVTLDNGLQYEVVVAGDGEVPAPDDVVTVHYRGSFVDDTEFDSSYAHDAPAKFQVGGAIEGWSEALTRMPVGSTWKVVVPPELAYGESGAGDVIGPQSTLVFEIELLGIG